MLEKFINRFSLNERGQLPALSVGLLTLPFLIVYILIVCLIIIYALAGRSNEGTAIVSIFFLLIMGFGLLLWTLSVTITAALFRFTNNTTLNYIILSLVWFVIFIYINGSGLDVREDDRFWFAAFGLPAASGFALSAYIEKRLKEHLQNIDYSDFRNNDNLLDDDFLK